MFWRKPHQDTLRPLVLANLTRLQRLFHARGRRFDFDRDATTKTLENGLWGAVGETADDMGLLFAPEMPLEHRIAQIERQLEPLARPGAGQANLWPNFLQTAR